MMLGISAEVILRIFGFPSLIGLIELTEYALFISTFFVAPYLLRTNEHIRVDIVMTRVDPAAARLGRMRRARRHHADLAGDRRCRRARSWSRSIAAGTLVFKDLIFPQWWLDWIIPLSSLAMLLQALELLVDLCRARPRSAHDAVRGRPRHPAGRTAVSWVSILGLMFAAKVLLLLTALPVAFVFFIINIAGSYLIFGGYPGLEQMVRNEQLSVAQFSLVPIPLFVLMGEVLFHTGLAMKSVDAVDAVIRRVPGRLAVVTLVAGTIFSAISGSTIATTAMLGSLLLPQMLERSYEPKTAMGPILAIGGVDILIPPSGLAVLLGSLAGISISGLLVGGIVPGLILSALVHRLCPAALLDQPGAGAALRRRQGRASPHPWLNLCVTVAAADPDFRHRGRQHDRRLGDADRIERARRLGDDPARAPAMAA